MSLVIVTGSSGLIGSEAARHFHDLGWDVIGIDNDMRRAFFGVEASTKWMRERLERELRKYRHWDFDIRDEARVHQLVKGVANDLKLIIHAAAQPSHDWAAQEPMTDFSVNALGTLVLLEAARKYSPDVAFIFTSTNKVYGDSPNRLPLLEKETRFELPEDHPWYMGIPEAMSIDQSIHSIFGVSKVAADLFVQEYGLNFGVKTITFRGGCLTGPGHSGAELHGFLAYLMKCVVTNRPYTVFGYKGKQVRDNIHSVDLIRAFDCVAEHPPKPGSVYNIGGGRRVNCSMLEAIQLCEKITGKELHWTYSNQNRIGDHRWWIGDFSAFQNDYPQWAPIYGIEAILEEIYELNRARWESAANSLA